MKEVWASVDGYENHYEVSDMGRVRSNRKVLNHFYVRGYPIVTLCKLGVRTKKYVHRLVAEAFIGALPEGQHTDHIDRDVKNNCVDNLRYVSVGENVRNAKVRKGVTSKYKGVCKRRDKWGAFIAIEGKQQFLGHFDSEIEAAQAYDRACTDSRTTNFKENRVC